MSFNCFIVLVHKMLGPVPLLAFAYKIRPFPSSTVIGIIKWFRLFEFLKNLKKSF